MPSPALRPRRPSAPDAVRRPQRSWRLWALGLLAALALGAVPSRAAAQGVPVIDKNSPSVGIWLVEHIAEAYTMATVYRDAMLKKTKQFIKQTRKAQALRQKYEQMARGELGELGKKVPRWDKYANFCAVNAAGVSVCNANTLLHQAYENILDSTYVKYKTEAFKSVAGTRRSVRNIVGSAYGNAAAAVDTSTGGRLRLVTGERTRARTNSITATVATSAESVAELRELNEELKATVDSIMANEVRNPDGTTRPISSGRAKQLTANLTLIQTRIELAIAHAQISTLQMQVAIAADLIRDRRQTLGILRTGRID